MSYGISVVNSNGVEVLNTERTTWNVLDFFLVSSSQTVPIPASGYCTEFKVAIYHTVEFPSNQKAILYVPTINGTSVTFTGGNITTLAVVMGR